MYTVGDSIYRIGYLFVNWSLVVCSDKDVKEDVMLMIVAVVTVTVRAPRMSSSITVGFALKQMLGTNRNGARDRHSCSSFVLKKLRANTKTRI